MVKLLQMVIESRLFRKFINLDVTSFIIFILCRFKFPLSLLIHAQFLLLLRDLFHSITCKKDAFSIRRLTFYEMRYQFLISIIKKKPLNSKEIFLFLQILDILLIYMKEPQEKYLQAQKRFMLKKIKQYKFLFPSILDKYCCSSEFDLRFQSIKDSLVTAGICGKIQGFYRWRTQYTNLSIPTDPEQLQRQLPINKNPDFSCDKKKIKYTWIGHSTAVIALGSQINILIDPVFSDRSSPFQWIGPKRFRQTPCKIKDLPQIDLVLISHDHYDHLDQHSLLELQKKDKPHFVAGLGSNDVVPGGKSRMHQLDWTQTIELNIKDTKLQVTFLPVCHWGRRWMLDQNKRLWGGFIIKAQNGKKIFYSGDTGYCQVFKQIGQQYGPIDLCILPIGAYQPRQLLKAQHVNPDQAVTVHKQLKSVKSVGVHWGTFPLGWEHWCAARTDLKQASKKQGLKEDQFITVGHGSSFQIYY